MKNIQNELRDLSYRVLSLHDGVDEALTWRRELVKRQSLLFAWETELMNPKYLPEWVILKYAKTESEIPWNSSRWSAFREREWERKIGSQIVIDGQIYCSPTDTDPKLVKVPTQKDTRELYESIVQTIPLTIYDWCEDYEKLFPTFKSDGIFLIDRTDGLTIMPVALEFLIAKASSHAHQGQNALSTIKDIESPLPEIEEYKNKFNKRQNRVAHRHSSEEGNFFVSRKEFVDMLLAEFERAAQEAEDEIATENSRLDEEPQNASRDENATEQPDN